MRHLILLRLCNGILVKISLDIIIKKCLTKRLWCSLCCSILIKCNFRQIANKINLTEDLWILQYMYNCNGNYCNVFKF